MVSTTLVILRVCVAILKFSSIKVSIREKSAVAKSFSYDTELQLEKGNADYKADQKALTINAEFLRITLLSQFLSQLDRHSNCLLSIFKTKGGAMGQKISGAIQILDQPPQVSYGFAA
ncbi:hypothetical protein N1851_032320 [Merluccius polli]|uniref:Uncharacterized protein n=1 Tax=Merluccius polli TaxID=89951 RepID=A0AA47NQI6_MERPO|nr:hypothetical protein N1851_032320 [Merluccius polli]